MAEKEEKAAEAAGANEAAAIGTDEEPKTEIEGEDIVANLLIDDDADLDVDAANEAAAASEASGAEATGEEVTPKVEEISGEEKPAEGPEGEGEAPIVEKAEAEEEAAAKEAEAKQALTETPPDEEPAVTEEPVADALTDEEMRARYLAWREGTEEEVAKHYAIDEDVVDELELSPETAHKFSRTLARVYVDAVQGAVSHMVQAMPRLVEQTLATRDRDTQFETDFFEAWPKLSAEKHMPVIQRLGTSYRAQNPTADPATFIRDVGASAMISLKIPHEVSPARPKVGAGKPFVPAGSVTTSGKPTKPGNIFGQMAEDLDKEDVDGLDLD